MGNPIELMMRHESAFQGWLKAKGKTVRQITRTVKTPIAYDVREITEDDWRDRDLLMEEYLKEQRDAKP